MWSVGISVSPCEDAARIGYDYRQINRIVIRVAQYFLDRNMCVIFGHDWREDGVMRAVADFACMVAAGARDSEEKLARYRSRDKEDGEESRMLNVVPTGRDSLSRVALEAQREAGGVLEVLTSKEAMKQLPKPMSELSTLYGAALGGDERAAELTALRHCITALLNPGCRICLGGKTRGYEGGKPGVLEEAKIALEWGKPLYLLGGFGGATRFFGAEDAYGRLHYWKTDNGLSSTEKKELFETTDIARALKLISDGIKKSKHYT